MKFEEFIAEMKPFHNHIGIAYDMELVRLLGVHNGEMDYYYIFQALPRQQKFATKDGIWYGTAVGHFISLKDIYPKERYKYMDECFSLNGSKSTEEFLITEHDHLGYIRTCSSDIEI